MIVPSRKLKEFIKLYPSQSALCELVKLDEAILSHLITGNRGASASIMEKICQGINWTLSDAWEIAEGEEE